MPSQASKMHPEQTYDSIMHNLKFCNNLNQLAGVVIVHYTQVACKKCLRAIFCSYFIINRIHIHVIAGSQAAVENPISHMLDL